MVHTGVLLLSICPRRLALTLLSNQSLHPPPPPCCPTPEFYREKLRAEVDGRSYTPPPPSADNKVMPRNRSFAASPHTGQAEWDDWGGSGAAAGGSGGGGQPAQRSGSEYTLTQLQVCGVVLVCTEGRGNGGWGLGWGLWLGWAAAGSSPEEELT